MRMFWYGFYSFSNFFLFCRNSLNNRHLFSDKLSSFTSSSDSES